MKLKLADSLSLPLDAVTQKHAWLGVTGSGKTYGASKLAELFWHAGAQFVVLDPVGVWYGLRLAKNGKTPSDVKVPIFGGLHADVPLEPTGGALLANLIVDKTLSAIIDLSQFESDAQKARFAHDFADRLFFRKKAAASAIHLFLEECQEFVPQNPQRGEEQMLHVFTRLQKLGRNFGIGSSYLSQRPQEVNKKALNMAQTLFVFRTTGTHERAAIEKWIADKALDQDIAGDLPKMATGDCHVWSPEFLKVSEIVHILEKETFNASATPEVGAVAKARELAPIDLDQVRADMAATIEKAKADDPRELRKTIADLRKEIANKSVPAVPPESADEKHLRDLIVKQRKDLAKLRALARENLERVLDHLHKHAEAQLHRWSAQEQKAQQWLQQLRTTAIIDLERSPNPVGQRPATPSRPRTPAGSTPALSATPSAAGLDGAQQKILDVVAMLEVRGIEATRDSVARWLDIHPNGGRYGSNLAYLRAEGYLNGFQLTISGTAAARAMATGLEAAKQPLDGAQRAIVEALELNNQHFTRDTLAEFLGIHPNGGRYGSNLARLRTMGLIPERGPIHLTEAAHR